MSLNPGVTMVPPSDDRGPVVVVTALAIVALLALAFVIGYYVL